MAKILQPKIQATGLMDSFELAVMKTVFERATMPVIGNGTMTSGAMKLVAGGVLPSVISGKHGGLASSAFIVDGVEDLAHSLLGGILPGAASGAGEW